MSSVVVERNVMVRMRDGLHLATDIYRPVDEDGRQLRPLPVILERTPYDKSGISRSEVTAEDPNPVSRVVLAEFFARHGFVVAVQDCRGRYCSEGVFQKYVAEAEDGYDTLVWLQQQPWCDGRIGTMGFSYGAHTQCALACLDPPGLACMFMDSGGFASAFHGGIRRGGAFELKQATWAHRHARLSPETQADPVRAAKLGERDIREWFRDMPWQPGHSPLAGAPEYETYLFELWRAGRFSDYWQQPGLCAERYYDRFPDVPTAIVGSWYDPYVLTCLDNFKALSRRHASRVQLMMGPWTHGDRSRTYAGDVDFGREATLDEVAGMDYRRVRLEWFRRWLCDSDADAAAPEPRVAYFQMGGGPGSRDANGRIVHGGRWRHADCWPPAGTRLQTLFLHADGRLLDREPAVPGQVEYCYDPSDPVPTVGGALTSGMPVMRGGPFDQREAGHVFKYHGAPNGRPLAERADVLVFETAELEEPLVVCGTIEVELFVSSDCPDTDFTAKLVDVYPPSRDFPEGFAMNVTDGIFRMRYRDGWDREVLMEEGETYAITIRPFATANLFQAGHRLRLDISSSNYPHFDINPNTGAPVGFASASRVAHNRVLTGGQHVSRVRLSTMPAR